jgi:hypothetical protein
MMTVPLPEDIPLIRPCSTADWPLLMHCPYGVAEALREHFFRHEGGQQLGQTVPSVGMDEITVITFNNRSQAGLVERQAAKMEFPHFRAHFREIPGQRFISSPRAALAVQSRSRRSTAGPRLMTQWHSQSRSRSRFVSIDSGSLIRYISRRFSRVPGTS